MRLYIYLQFLSTTIISDVSVHDIDGLMQDCSKTIANALELRSLALSRQ